MKRLIPVAALTGSLLLAGTLPATAAPVPAPTVSAGDAVQVKAAKVPAGDAVQVKAAKVHKTTLYLHGTYAKVWKTWTKAKGGGYNGSFGVTKQTRGVTVTAWIDWNSGRSTIKNLKPGKKYPYRGAKRVLLQLCGDWECSAKW